MENVHGISVSGGSFPAEIWRRMMERTIGLRPAGEFPEPKAYPSTSRSSAARSRSATTRTTSRRRPAPRPTTTETDADRDGEDDRRRRRAKTPKTP